MAVVDLRAERKLVGHSRLRWRARARLVPRPQVLIPSAASVLAVVPSLVWIARDDSIWPWDPAWYGQVSVDLWAALRLEPGTWPGTMVHAFGAKPPAIAWLGQFFVPWGHKLGSTQISLLVSVVCCQVVVLALVYVAAHRLAGRVAPAMVAVLLTAGAPLFVSLSHEYFPEPIQAVSVAWALLIMVSAPRWRPSLTVVQLVAAVAFGLLTKISTPLYQAAPAVVALAGAAWFGRTTAFGMWYRDAKLILSAAGATLLSFAAATWYAVNYDAARKHVELAQSTLYGPVQPFWTSLDAWFERFWDAVFLPYLWLLPVVPLAAGVSAASARWILRRRVRTRHRVRGPAVYAAMCVAAPVATILLLLTLLAGQPNNESRYLMPLIPCLAVSAAGLLAAVGHSIAAWLAAAGLAAEFLLANLIALGAISSSTFGADRLVHPVRPEFASDLRRIVHTTCVPNATDNASVVGTEYPWLNFNTLMFLAHEQYALVGRPCYYTSLGYAERDPQSAWQRLLDLDPPYFIGVDYGNPANRLPLWIRQRTNSDDAFNRVNVVVFRQLVRSGRFILVPGSRRNGLVVYRARGFTPTDS